jgi:AraC family transcriptional activator of pobA
MTKSKSHQKVFGDKLPSGGSKFSIYECDDFRAQPVPYSRRDFYKITLLFGTSRLEYANKGIIIDKPALLFTNPTVPYFWEPISEEQKGYFVLFTEAFFQDTYSDHALEHSALFRLGSDPVYYIDPDQIVYIKQIFQNMYKEFHSDYVHKFELLRNHLNVLMHEALKMQPMTSYFEHQNAATRIASLFLELVDRQFPADAQRPFTLRTPKQYAELLSIHVNHLNRSVKDATGKTTSEHISDRIIAEAKALILNTDWNVSEISYVLGYEYPTYFNNFFKKRTRTNPTAFKENRIIIQ